MMVEMPRTTVSPQNTLLDYMRGQPSRSCSASHASGHDTSEGETEEFTPLHTSLSAVSLSDQYTNYLIRYAKAKLSYRIINKRFSTYDLFRDVKFPEGYDLRNLGNVMRALTTENVIQICGSGKVRRFRGNSGIGCYYEKTEVE